jgi:hypothetical protein
VQLVEPQVFSEVRVAQSLVLCEVFCSLDCTDPGTSKYVPIGIHLLLPHVDYVKKSLKAPKRYSADVNRRRTDNTMTKTNGINGQIRIYKTLQHTPLRNKSNDSESACSDMSSRVLLCQLDSSIAFNLCIQSGYHHSIEL